MRWTGFMLALFLASSSAPAQQQTSITPEAQAYLAQASQSLLQRAPGNPPFHLKAVFTATTTISPDSKTSPVVENGSYEETWLSRTQWRRDFTVGGKTYATGRLNGQYWQTASGADVPMSVYAVTRCMVPTLSAVDPRPPTSKKSTSVTLTRVQLSGMSLDRIGDSAHVPHGGKRDVDEAAYYFVPENRLLLSITTGPSAIEFKKSAIFAGKTVLINGTATSLGFPRIDFSIEALSSPPQDAATRLLPPAGAEIQSVPENGTGEETSARCISCPQPVYPAIAKSAHISGTVVLAGVVREDGRMTELKLVSGPPLLRQAVFDAVKDWKYEPAKVDGVAVPVSTYINVSFEIFLNR